MDVYTRPTARKIQEYNQPKHENTLARLIE